MQLAPNEKYPIVRQLTDPTDVNTYYVQAKVYKSDKTLLQTINLTDEGSQMFYNLWEVPADTSGLGTYIYITTTVFTDSGYTTKSSNYGIESTTLLIQNRITTAALGGGTGGMGYANINYPSLMRGIKDELKALIQEVVDESLTEKLNSIDGMVKDKTNYKLIKRMLKNEIASFPLPKHIDKNDVADVLKNNKVSEKLQNELKGQLDTLNGTIIERVKGIEDALRGIFSKGGFDKANMQTQEVVSKMYAKLDTDLAKAFDKLHTDLSTKVEKENAITKAWVKDHVEKYIDYLENLVEKEITKKYGMSDFLQMALREEARKHDLVK